jgi:hypothetical protein
LSQLAEQNDFAGLDFDGFGVFPTIKLESGEFISSDGESLGNEFHCQMVRSRPKFLYATDFPYGDPRNETAYSYDNETSTTGVPLAQIFASWEQKGLPRKAQPTRYVEVTAQLVPSGRLVLLSVSQASISNLSAFWAQMQYQGKDIRQIVTRVFRGAKIDKARVAFYPWAFAAVE